MDKEVNRIHSLLFKRHYNCIYDKQDRTILNVEYLGNIEVLGSIIDKRMIDQYNANEKKEVALSSLTRFIDQDYISMFSKEMLKIIPEDITEIEPCTFMLNKDIRVFDTRKMSLVRDIPMLLFYGSEIEEVIIGDNIKSIGYKAFGNCAKLRILIIGKNVEDINIRELTRTAKDELRVPLRKVYVIKNSTIAKRLKRAKSSDNIRIVEVESIEDAIKLEHPTGKESVRTKYQMLLEGTEYAHLLEADIVGNVDNNYTLMRRLEKARVVDNTHVKLDESKFRRIRIADIHAALEDDINRVCTHIFTLKDTREKEFETQLSKINKLKTICNITTYLTDRCDMIYSTEFLDIIRGYYNGDYSCKLMFYAHYIVKYGEDRKSRLGIIYAGINNDTIGAFRYKYAKILLIVKGEEIVYMTHADGCLYNNGNLMYEASRDIIRLYERILTREDILSTNINTGVKDYSLLSEAEKGVTVLERNSSRDKQRLLRMGKYNMPVRHGSNAKERGLVVHNIVGNTIIVPSIDNTSMDWILNKTDEYTEGLKSGLRVKPHSIYEFQTMINTDFDIIDVSCGEIIRVRYNTETKKDVEVGYRRSILNDEGDIGSMVYDMILCSDPDRLESVTAIDRFKIDRNVIENEEYFKNIRRILYKQHNINRIIELVTVEDGNKHYENKHGLETCALGVIIYKNKIDSAEKLLINRELTERLFKTSIMNLKANVSLKELQNEEKYNKLIVCSVGIKWFTCFEEVETGDIIYGLFEGNVSATDKSKTVRFHTNLYNIIKLLRDIGETIDKNGYEGDLGIESKEYKRDEIHQIRFSDYNKGIYKNIDNSVVRLYIRHSDGAVISGVTTSSRSDNGAIVRNVFTFKGYAEARMFLGKIGEKDGNIENKLRYKYSNVRSLIAFDDNREDNENELWVMRKMVLEGTPDNTVYAGYLGDIWELLQKQPKREELI